MSSLSNNSLLTPPRQLAELYLGSFYLVSPSPQQNIPAANCFGTASGRSRMAQKLGKSPKKAQTAEACKVHPRRIPRPVDLCQTWRRLFITGDFHLASETPDVCGGPNPTGVSTLRCTTAFTREKKKNIPSDTLRKLRDRQLEAAICEKNRGSLEAGDPRRDVKKETQTQWFRQSSQCLDKACQGHELE